MRYLLLLLVAVFQVNHGYGRWCPGGFFDMGTCNAGCQNPYPVGAPLAAQPRPWFGPLPSPEQSSVNMIQAPPADANMDPVYPGAVNLPSHPPSYAPMSMPMDNPQISNMDYMPAPYEGKSYSKGVYLPDGANNFDAGANYFPQGARCVPPQAPCPRPYPPFPLPVPVQGQYASPPPGYALPDEPDESEEDSYDVEATVEHPTKPLPTSYIPTDSPCNIGGYPTCPYVGGRQKTKSQCGCSPMCLKHYAVKKIRPVYDECISKVPVVQNVVRQQCRSTVENVPVQIRQVCGVAQDTIKACPLKGEVNYPYICPKPCIPFKKSCIVPALQTYLIHVPLCKKACQPTYNTIRPIFQNKVIQVPVTRRICRPVVEQRIVSVPVKKLTKKHYVQQTIHKRYAPCQCC